MSKNVFAKGRGISNPYAIYKGQGFEWRVLKTYQLTKNYSLYSRWFVAASSEYTHGEFELGDTYVNDVVKYGVIVAATPEWLADMQEHGYIGYGKQVPTTEEYLSEGGDV